MSNHSDSVDWLTSFGCYINAKPAKHRNDANIANIVVCVCLAHTVCKSTCHQRDARATRGCARAFLIEAYRVVRLVGWLTGWVYAAWLCCWAMLPSCTAWSDSLAKTETQHIRHIQTSKCTQQKLHTSNCLCGRAMNWANACVCKRAHARAHFHLVPKRRTGRD